ncbi:head decoration protein [Brevundimonas faecalis]|uniref:Head decoration protein n=1 Tax=Brevundimonas faecalis TaxID=947378 RepID=A0ABV2RAS5_9CAUL
MRAYVFKTDLPGLSDLIHSEYDPTYTTDERKGRGGVGTARAFPAFVLLGTILIGAATVTAGAVVGTGNGAIGAVTADVGAPAGVYSVVVVSAAANGGSFQVIKPDGGVDGAGSVGVAYNGALNFTLADGSTDFAVGDRIPVTVAYAAGVVEKDVPWDPAATDGTQIITGINLFEAEAPVGQDVELKSLRRGPVIVRREAIVWPAGATAALKEAAYARLAELGIRPFVSG